MTQLVPSSVRSLLLYQVVRGYGRKYPSNALGLGLVVLTIFSFFILALQSIATTLLAAPQLGEAYSLADATQPSGFVDIIILTTPWASVDGSPAEVDNLLLPSLNISDALNDALTPPAESRAPVLAVAQVTHHKPQATEKTVTPAQPVVTATPVQTGSTVELVKPQSPASARPAPRDAFQYGPATPSEKPPSSGETRERYAGGPGGPVR